MAHPQSKPIGHGRDLVDPDLQGQIVVIDIAGLFQRVLQVDPAVSGAFPAVKPATGHFQVAGAIDGSSGPINPSSSAAMAVIILNVDPGG